MFKLGLNLFNLYVAISDSELDEEEAELINNISETNFTKLELLKIAQKAEINKKDFATQVPMSLKVFVEADNVTKETNIEASLSDGIYQLYALSGVYIMIINENIKEDEYHRIMSYLKVMYDYMKKNLKHSSGKIQKPADVVSSLLAKVSKDNPDLTIDIDYKEPKESKKRAVEDEDRDIFDLSDSASHEDEDDEEEEEDTRTLDELLQELNSMIGLEEVKYEVTSLINLFRIKKMREDIGLKMPSLSKHLVFSGNPGTGKTSVARLLAKIYKKIGVLSKGHLIETDRSGLIAGYVGQTALKVNDLIEQAMGGILFIDEAYALTANSNGNDYGQEAISILLKAMEDKRDDLIVIVAGYPDLMEGFLDSNPGLRSRFNKFIYFRDYTPSELTRIFQLFCDNNGYRASIPALSYILDYFKTKCAEKSKNFANAREVRNIFEFSLSRQANRVVMISNVTQNDLTLLTLADVSGENADFGKQQFMAKLAMFDLSKNKRYGISEEHFEIMIDELELSASTADVLATNHISSVVNILDFIDSNKSLDKLNGINDEEVEELTKSLEVIGFTMG